MHVDGLQCIVSDFSWQKFFVVFVSVLHKQALIEYASFTRTNYNALSNNDTTSPKELGFSMLLSVNSQ